jgi:hypothetical protein
MHTDGHRCWCGAARAGMFAGPPSDLRLRRALGTVAQGWPSSEPALQASLRRRLRFSHDLTAWAGGERVSHVKRQSNGTLACRSSRTAVGKRGSVEQAHLQSGDLRSSPGRQGLPVDAPASAYGDVASGTDPSLRLPPSVCICVNLWLSRVPRLRTHRLWLRPAAALGHSCCLRQRNLLLTSDEDNDVV